MKQPYYYLYQPIRIYLAVNKLRNCILLIIVAEIPRMFFAGEKITICARTIKLLTNILVLIRKKINAQNRQWGGNCNTRHGGQAYEVWCYFLTFVP